MDSHPCKEEGELSDEEENGKNKAGISNSKLMTNTNFHNNIVGADFKPESDFGKLSRPDNYHKFKVHSHQTLSTHGILPNPRHILPRPAVPHPHMKKEKDRACIVIKNNTNVSSNHKRREFVKDVSDVPLKSPSSKIWDNRKLRHSRDKYKNGNANQEDNFQTLLQQYKNIQAQPDAVKHKEDHNELATPTLVEKGTLAASQVTSDIAEPSLEKQNESGKQETQDDEDADVKEDDFDDELDLLELRRNALASLLAEAREEADTGESECSLQGGIKPSDNKAVRRSSPKSAERSSSREGLSKSQNRSRNKPDVRAQRHSRFLRARTPALRSYKTSKFTSRRPYKIDDRTPRRSRQTSQSRSSLSSARLRPPSDGDRTVPSRREKRSYLADTNDIQKILSLNDPEEKVARLLAMLDRNLSKESEKRALDVKVNPSKDLEGVDSEPTQDNYEEVEMDIDSDPESTPAAPVNPVEELQFEPDFYNAMQPMYMTMQPAYDGYDSSMGWSVQGPSFSDTAVHVSVNQQQQYLPVPMMSFSDSHIPIVPSNTSVFPDVNGPYQYIDQQQLQIVRDQITGLRDIIPPPPPPPLPCEPPPNPPLPPSDSPPLPTSSPPPLPTESLPPPPLPSNLELHNQNKFVDSLPVTTFQSSQHYFSNLNMNNSNNNINIQENQDFNHHGNLVENHDHSRHGDSESRLFNLAGYNPTVVSGSWNSRNKENSNFNSSTEINSNLAGDTKGRGNERHPLPEDEIGNEVDDGEEEETMLRAQLLQSMMKKMKEKQKLLEDASRSDSSPSRSQSPSSAPVAKTTKPVPQKQSYTRIHMANLPVHKPVIINLGEDSSDEEEEKSPTAPSGVQKLLGGLDSFLKEARRSTETTGGQSPKRVDSEKVLQMKRRQALMSRVRQEEINLLKQSETITKDQTLLKTLVNQASKYLQNVRISETKVKQLTEQLAAAEKVATANKDNLEKAKKQARMVKDRLLKKKKDYETLQKGLIEAGRELHGADYKIGAPQPVRKRVVQSTKLPLVNSQSENTPNVSKPVGKLKMKDNMTVTISNAPVGQTDPVLNNDIVANSQKKVGNMTASLVTETSKTSENLNNILTEKQTLLEMKALIEKQKKLELEQQRKKKEQILRAKEEKLMKIMKLRQEIQLGEMKLKHAEIDKQKSGSKSLESEKIQNGQKDLGMSKSVLKLEKIELGSDPIDLTNESQENQKKRRRSLLELNHSTKPDLKIKAELIRNKSTEEKDSHFEITIPEGKNLLRILKLQKQRVDEDLKTFAHLTSDSYKVNQEYPALSIKQQQISSLQAYKAPINTATNISSAQTSGFVYKSPLLHFKSYRFSPYFRTKACKNLTSRCVANKLLPKIVLCRYDLLGTCNDEKCKGQHQKQYLPSDREILLDIVAYSPAIAGVQKDTPFKKVSKLMGDYVDDMLKQNKGRFTVDQMCLILVNKVNEHVKHVPPHTMLYAPRLFRPRQDEKVFSKSEKPTFKQTKDDEAFQFLASVQTRPEDTVIESEDQRYFYSQEEGSEVQDLESAVLATPTDTQLWLKLAQNKLHSSRLSSEACLEEALNVLARGLESNKDSSVLWLEYLTLYARHKEASDFSDLCQMALQYAPSFEIWWKYLHSLVTYKDRNEICSEIIDYLCSIQTKTNISPTVSHHLLEVILYRAHLSIIAGQLQYAKNILQGYFVKSEGKVSCQTNLTVQDRCILWLCYIHVLSWQHLPDALWDSSSSGKIINKDDLVLPWRRPPSGSFTRDQQMALLQEAINVCITGEEPKHSTALREGLILYKNVIQLLQCQNKLEEILSVCRHLLQKDQSLIEIWLIVANLYAENGEEDATIQVFNDALEVNPLSAMVFNIAAHFGMSRNADFTMTCLENCPLRYFVLDDNVLPDPLSLYCVLLNQTLPLGYNPPVMKEEVSKDLISQQEADLWLNYCLFLEQRKDYAAVIEMYETALSAMVTARDTGKIWSGYIGFQYRQVQCSAKNVSQQTIEQRRLNYLFHRCIVTMPKKLPLKHWNMEHVLDYRPVNSVIECYLGYLLPEQQTLTLERIVNMMPNNLSLVLRLCEEYLCQGSEQQALGLCYPLMCDGTHNGHIWKLATTLAIRQRSHTQIEKLFFKAVQAVPYSVNIWKNFLMYQLTQGNQAREMILAILQHCNLLGLNMEELLQVIKS